MSDEQFVIWFRGFTDAVRTAPTIDQWEVIKERLGSVKKTVYPIMLPPQHPLFSYQVMDNLNDDQKQSYSQI